MANTDPVANLTHTVYFALAVAFASATQDIALDAYRIEAVETEKQGAMAATYQAGYRIAMITAGAGALWIAAAVDPSEATYDFRPWQVAYTAMAALMGVGLLTTLAEAPLADLAVSDFHDPRLFAWLSTLSPRSASLR